MIQFNNLETLTRKELIRLAKTYDLTFKKETKEEIIRFLKHFAWFVNQNEGR